MTSNRRFFGLSRESDQHITISRRLIELGHDPSRVIIDVFTEVTFWIFLNLYDLVLHFPNDRHCLFSDFCFSLFNDFVPCLFLVLSPSHCGLFLFKYLLLHVRAFVSEGLRSILECLSLLRINHSLLVMLHCLRYSPHVAVVNHWACMLLHHH